MDWEEEEELEEGAKNFEGIFWPSDEEREEEVSQETDEKEDHSAACTGSDPLRNKEDWRKEDNPNENLESKPEMRQLQNEGSQMDFD